MTLVDFALAKLSDRMIAALLDAIFENDRGAELNRAIARALFDEQDRRRQRRDAPKVVLVLPWLDGHSEILQALENLTRSSFDLETMAATTEDPVRAEELKLGAEFCYRIAAALARQGKALTRAALSVN